MPNESKAMVFNRKAFESLRLGLSLTDKQAMNLFESDTLPLPVKSSAFIALATSAKITSAESLALNSLSLSLSKDFDVLNQINKKLTESQLLNLSDEDTSWMVLLKSVYKKKPIGENLFQFLIDKVTNSPDSMPLISAFLMLVCKYGLLPEDLKFLTIAMSESGKKYDYRNEQSLNGFRLIRRYPTGALSEKTALILPALIASARKVVNVATPFLVARSLGFTGGTWDKLKAIDQFEFPEPGNETIEALIECGVAMTVTNGDANPADRILYQLRSITGTIESVPLIVSSIASKHICYPVDRLLMDVRFGEGAFLSTKEEAEKLGSEICELLTERDIPSFYELTDTPEPTGSAIGNALEVAESIAIMNIHSIYPFDQRVLDTQKKLVIHFFSLLMAKEFDDLSYSHWNSFAENAFESGEVLKSFSKILICHKVSHDYVQRLIHEPLKTLELENYIDVKSLSTGTLCGIDQKSLGEIVNMSLGGGGNDFLEGFDSHGGILIRFRLGDVVKAGESLCFVYSSKIIGAELLNAIVSCFTID